MKQQQHYIEFMESSEKKSQSQMVFEPMTLRDLVVGSNTIWDSNFFPRSP